MTTGRINQVAIVRKFGGQFFTPRALLQKGRLSMTKQREDPLYNKREFVMIRCETTKVDSSESTLTILPASVSRSAAHSFDTLLGRRPEQRSASLDAPSPTEKEERRKSESVLPGRNLRCTPHRGRPPQLNGVVADLEHSCRFVVLVLNACASRTSTYFSHHPGDDNSQPACLWAGRQLVTTDQHPAHRTTPHDVT